MPLRLRALHLAIVLGLLAAFAGGPARVSATPAAAPAVGLVVNVLTDAADAAPGNGVCATATPGQCSLRAALEEANALAGPDAITFSVTGIITLTSASPIVTETVTIVGPGAALLTIDADQTGSVLHFNPSTTATYQVESLTLTGGLAGDGGGLYVAGASTLVISATVLTGNAATSGGGLRVASNTARVQLINSQVITNGAGLRGGGVASSGELEISNSRIEGNWVEVLIAATGAAQPQGAALNYAGGGLYANGPLTMTDSLVLGNTALAPTCAQSTAEATACLAAAAPAGGGSGPYGAGLALVGSRAVLRDSLVAGNYFGPACGACAAAPAGVSTGLGGGIYNYLGDLALIDTELLDNAASEGGGLYTLLGDVLLLRARVVDNTANVAGGGVVSESGPLGIDDSLFVDNRANSGPAGGLRFSTGALIIRNSEFDDNSAALGGGGLSIFDALVTIDDTAIHHNRAGYTPFAAAALAPQGGGGPGGGLLLGTSIAVVRQSAIYSNTAEVGGGLSNSGTLTLTNVTLSGNSATSHGGGLYLSLPPVSVAGGPSIQAYLRHVTVAGNLADSDNNGTGNGGGVFAGAGQTITFNSTLVADNVDRGGEAPACGGPGSFVSTGYNLWTATTNCVLVAMTGDQFNVAAGLVPLQDNGGPTLTHGLRLDSLALHAADQSNCPPNDQRGVNRPFGAGCDIGAFELAGIFLPLAVR